MGSHRMWATTAVAMLLSFGLQQIDAAISKTRLVQQLLDLAVQRPLCTALHTKALHVLYACANSKEDGLLAPLLTSRGTGANPSPSLLDKLVDLGEYR